MYMERNIAKIIDNDWVLYLSRPYNLFTSSIWYYWYESDNWTVFFNIKPPTVLLIESETGIVRQYWLQKEMDKYYEVRKEIILKKRHKIITALKKSEALNKRVVKILKSKKKIFFNLKDGVDFLCQVAFYGTVLPFAILEAINKYNINDKSLITLAQKLRKTSYYPEIQNKIVLPLARDWSDRYTILKNKNFFDLITYQELLKGKVTHTTERLKKRNDKKYFLNQYRKGREKIFWLKNSKEILNVLDKTNIESQTRIKGRAAHKGKVIGTARVMFNPKQGITFNNGDILVTVNSNPSFMPYISKCSALITDEGGIMCHAAIISREKKIPCVMSTKNATTLIKNGDYIEVDADKGLVTILKKA